MSQVAILIPTMRANRLPDVVRTIEESTDDYRIVVIATGECADVARTLPVTLIEDDGGTWAQRINHGVRETTEQFLFTGADDLAFRPGWFEAALRALDQFPNAVGLVAVNDLHNAAGVHFLFHRDYVTEFGCIDEPGVLCHEGYRHSYIDDEIRATALSHDRWSIARDSIVEHLHAGAGKAPHDDVYTIGAESMPQGLALFQSRAHLWGAA